MKHLFLATIVLFIISSCQNNKSVTKEKIITVDDLTKTAYEKVGDTITITGFCADMCHTGDYIVLCGADSSKAIQAIASPELKSFDQKIKYNNVNLKGVLHERRIDSVFLINWETNLDNSLKTPNANPPAVAQLKEQIARIYDEIQKNYQENGRNYWSQFTLQTLEYTINE